MHRYPLLFPLLLATLGAAGAPASQPQPQTPWGQAVEGLQSRLVVTNSPSKGSPVQVAVELRNTAEQPATLAHIRVWFMVAQGPQRVLYTATTPGPDKQTLERDASLSLTLDAAPLDVFPYDPKLVIKNGVPIPPEGEVLPLAPSLGKLTDFLPAGHAKAKAFVVVTQLGKLTDHPQTFVVPSNAFSIEVRERTLGALDPTARRAVLEEFTALFHGDAVSAKTAHDRALSLGKDVVPHLITLAGDPTLSGPGRMWITATLVDFKDDRAQDLLLRTLNAGGSAAYIVAYMAPATKQPALTAAIEKAAAATTDPTLTAWALRGLGNAGEPTDPTLLATMVTHSDSTGRMEAAEILAAHKAPQAVPLLAQLIRDQDAPVRIHAAAAAVAHHRRERAILQALQQMKNATDAPSRAAASAALDALQSPPGQP